MKEWEADLDGAVIVDPVEEIKVAYRKKCREVEALQERLIEAQVDTLSRQIDESLTVIRAARDLGIDPAKALRLVRALRSAA